MEMPTYTQREGDCLRFDRVIIHLERLCSGTDWNKDERREGERGKKIKEPLELLMTAMAKGCK